MQDEQHQLSPQSIPEHSVCLDPSFADDEVLNHLIYKDLNKQEPSRFDKIIALAKGLDNSLDFDETYYKYPKNTKEEKELVEKQDFRIPLRHHIRLILKLAKQKNSDDLTILENAILSLPPYKIKYLIHKSHIERLSELAPPNVTMIIA